MVVARGGWLLLGVLAVQGCSGWFGGEAPAPEPAEPSKAPRKEKKVPASMVPEGPRAPAPKGPNVLILVWDTVRADRTSAYGYALDTTPWLKAFAEEGVLFERAVSPGMWTLPSHASLFTGLPESAHGAMASHKWLDGRYTTLAESLWTAGWDTWLFSANPYLEDHTNLGQGFETREFPWDARWKKAAQAATRAKILPDDASNTLGPKWKERDYPAGRGNDDVKDAGPVVPDALGAWLAGREDPTRPWLAVVNYMEAHMPRIPSLEARKALFDDATIAEQLKVDQSYGYMLAATVEKHAFDAVAMRAISTVYDASLRDLDAATGKLIELLRTRGVLDDTIVVITSDHGEHLGEHHRFDHKYSVYQPLVRVPLVIRYPSRIPPARVKEVVSNLGIFATVAELTGVPMPAGTLSRSLLAPAAYDGRAFSELMAATPMALDRVSKVHPDLDRAKWMRTYASVETEDSKCIDVSDGTRELYAILADPLEEQNLAATQAERAGQVCGLIPTWRSTFTAWDRKSGERPGKASPELSSMLEELGYVEEGVKRGKGKARAEAEAEVKP